MHAAVVTSFNSAPKYQEIPAPTASGEAEMVMEVLAAGLHPRVRAQADGSHYTSTNELPLVPGIDGVGRGTDGLLRYFVLPDTTLGTMAERTVINTRRSVILPDDCDPVRIAAAMNPAMSAWIALRQRMQFERGQNVLVLGATGGAGQMAVQVARRLGADKIIAAGRNATALAGLGALGATAIVTLDAPKENIARQFAEMCADVDVVIDYLWGEPTSVAMEAIVAARADENQPLTWIEIGSVAGGAASIPSAALRSTRLQIIGSGQGSVSPREILAVLPELVAEIVNGTFEISTRTVALADVEAAWTDATNSQERVVIVP